MRSWLLVFTVLLISPGWAAETISLHAQTAGELAALCAAPPGSPAADTKFNFCEGFAQGAIDDRMSIVDGKRPFCFPNPTPKRPATMREFVSWVRVDPARLRLPAIEGLFTFLSERFPCK